MAGRENEPIPIRPIRILGVVGQDPRPKNVGQGGQGHGCALMARSGGVGCVHSQAPDHVDGERLERAVGVRSGEPGVRHDPTSANAASAPARLYRRHTIRDPPAPRRPFGRRSGGRSGGDRIEQESRGGKAVEVVGRPHRADLARTEHARHGGGSKAVRKVPSIVAGASEQVAAPPVAGEDQRCAGLETAEPCPKVGCGGIGVADLELDGCPDRGPVPDGYRTRGSVGPQDRPYEKVAAFVGLPVLVDDQSHVEPPTEAIPGLVISGVEDLPEALQSGPTGQGE